MLEQSKRDQAPISGQERVGISWWICLEKFSPSPAVRSTDTVAHTTSACCITAPLCFLPQMIKSLKKAMAPVLSDVSVEWVFPESTEVLVSPVSTSCLFPGDHLVGYSIICDTSPYISNPRSVSPTLCWLEGPSWEQGVLVCTCTSVGVHVHKRASWLFVRGQEASPAFSLCPQGRWWVRHQGEIGTQQIKVLVHKQWLLPAGSRLMDVVVGPIPSLCFSPGQEATLQHDAVPGVG